MNRWRSRIVLILALMALVQIHAAITAALPNTPLGMLLFHGSAGLGDLFLIYCAPTILSGPLCDDTQNLCLISIVANFIGWLLYMAYVPPEFFNSFMWGLGCVQCVRLLIVDGDDVTHLGLRLVRGPSLLGT